MISRNFNDLFVPVEKIPMEELLPDYEHISGLSYGTIITLPDGGKRIVNYCSEDYNLVRNQDIVTPFIGELSKFYDITTKVRVYNDTRFYVDHILNQKELAMSKLDIVNPKVTQINSYDGSVKYRFVMSFWRQICKNGLMGYVNWDSVTKMHTPGIGEETDFSHVMEMVSLFLAEADEHFERYRELDGQKVRKPELRVEEIIKETSFPSSLQEDVLSRLEEERNLLKVDHISDWLVYNAFNYQLNHNEEYKAKEDKKVKIDAEVFKYLLTY